MIFETFKKCFEFKGEIRKHMQSEEKLSYFSSGKPEHRLSYCAFLDVLGFSERIRNASHTSDSANELLQSFHHILTKSIAILKGTTDESMLYFKSFTDNVVLAHPRFSSDMESEFAFILWAINEYQFQMALNGFFIRGGLAIGQLFIDENSVYGVALLEAHHLESKEAINPIVVLCDKTMKLVDRHLNFYDGETAPQFRDVLKGPDGRYFLNYLTESILQDNDSEYLDTTALYKHKEQIEMALKKYSTTPTVFAKFTWLASYHNYFCEMVSHHDNYEHSLKISASLTATPFQRLTKN